MRRAWDDIKPSRRSQFPHPLLAFGAELAKISNENKAAHEAAGKTLISLAVGDPALDGNIPPPEQLMEELTSHISSGKANGYSPSVGLPALRAAIAEYWVRWFAPVQSGRLSEKDVVLSCGCSDALSMVFGAIAGPGDRILIPEPFFAQYDMTAAYYNIQPIYYPCLAEQNWEVDLVALRSIIEADTEHKIKAVLVNNPSNPCGSNFSRAHTEAFVQLMEELGMPIISDEIYAGMTFDIDEPSATVPFTSVADVDSHATRFIATGASKRFGIPGERIGWIIRVDPTGNGAEIFKGICNLSARYFLPMTPLQVALTTCLRETDETYFRQAKQLLCRNAAYLYDALLKTPGLKPMKPAGGMFMAVLLDKEDLDDATCNGVGFANLLALEENVHVFPGEPFHMKAAFRLTLSRPMDITTEAVARIQDFCRRHSRK